MRVGIARMSSHNSILKPHELPLFGIGERDLLGMAGVDVERRIFVGCQGWRALGLEAWPNANRVVGWGVRPPSPQQPKRILRGLAGRVGATKALAACCCNPRHKGASWKLVLGLWVSRPSLALRATHAEPHSLAHVFADSPLQPTLFLLSMLLLCCGSGRDLRRHTSSA
jgi:hypothetical protein